MPCQPHVSAQCTAARGRRNAVCLHGLVYAAVMLHEFLTSNRAELIDRCRAKVGRRSAPKATDDELTHGIPLFLDQLIKTLEVEQTLAPMRSREVSGASGGGGAPGEIGNAATIRSADSRYPKSISSSPSKPTESCSCQQWATCCRTHSNSLVIMARFG